MKNLDYKVIGVAIGLGIIAILSYVFWKPTSIYIMIILESKILTFFIWLILALTGIIHYYKNNAEDKNLISDKDGLDKPIDYLQFILTFGAIGSSIQILVRETFANYNFPKKSICVNFTGFDNATFVIVIIVLIFYSYGKIKPVIQETYVSKEKVRLKEDVTDLNKETNLNS